MSDGVMDMMYATSGEASILPGLFVLVVSMVVMLTWDLLKKLFGNEGGGKK